MGMMDKLGEVGAEHKMRMKVNTFVFFVRLYFLLDVADNPSVHCH